jgi:hypothetical protein
MQPERKQEKPGAKPQEQASPHPEKLAPPERVPGSERSKTTTSPQRDARTAHDKDGNEEHAPARKPS